ncbi:ABC transporter permease [Psychrobium sp. 1_MG-2023]|uniref:ABC transporter permease n=1 Tax=Psychrobium sp. 1_MG-2023 TaxID=3062624 RepID=UPI000C34B72F|nr:ABC transporter permease [Psychrobium sp. 1_MG-2023]MDP2560494.1 ABC transporter permease [Psychrobium sp. 1_MG-2023]PKF55192.1 multidrug ABC transporter substrate-binding protein [Alteromonadales bacterium alter-6D02]
MLNTLYSLLESTKAAMQAVAAHGMRSALTTLGIIIGVAAVITVVAVMESLSSNITEQLDDLGSDMVTLRAFTNAEQEMLGFSNKISYEDFLLLKGKVNNVSDMTATMRAFSLGSSVQFGRNTTQTQIIGTDSSYQRVIHVYPELGRFLSESDDLKRRRVAFIGSSVMKKLKMPDNPVGEFINLSGDWFRVIGVAETRGSLFGFDQDNYIIAPFSTIKSLNGSQVTDNIDIMFRPEQGASLSDIKEQMSRLLRQKHKLSGDDPDHFEFVTAEKTKQQFESITTSVTLVASGVVGISLLVGGIGIMNIMLVSVTERTKEIGIAKALGATPQFILFQFLIEALILSLLGGIIGLLLGYGLAALVAMMMPGSAGVMVPMWAIGLSFGFTTAIGVIFGLAPAVKAAQLNPVDALRYE